MKTQTYIDLHTHTNYSDGLYTTPRQNVMLAALKGISIFSITDHDTTRGYLEGKETAEKVGITFLPGVEITTPKYHLLALNFNPNDRELLEFLQHSKDIQGNRCKERVDALNRNGYELTFNEVQNAFPDSRLAKYNLFATMLMNRQCREKMERDYQDSTPLQRFRKLFGKNGILENLPDAGVPEKEAIKYVHNAGGVIGIAHPHKDIDDMSEMDRLVKLGIDFVEDQIHFRGRETGKYKIFEFVEFARNNYLPVTYGSDYHGPTFDRQIFEKEENTLSLELEMMLNQGFVKIPKRKKLEEVCC